MLAARICREHDIPIFLYFKKMVGVTGFEPATSPSALRASGRSHRGCRDQFFPLKVEPLAGKKWSSLLHETRTWFERHNPKS